MGKIIRGLDEPLITPEGKPLGDKKPILIKEKLINALFLAKSENPADSIRKQNKILPMLNASKKAIEFEDADFEIVKKSVEDNPEQMFDGYWGQVLMVLENAEDMVENKK